jgi:hypothetical protein
MPIVFGTSKKAGNEMSYFVNENFDAIEMAYDEILEECETDFANGDIDAMPTEDELWEMATDSVIDGFIDRADEMRKAMREGAI